MNRPLRWALRNNERRALARAMLHIEKAMGYVEQAVDLDESIDAGKPLALLECKAELRKVYLRLIRFAKHRFRLDVDKLKRYIK
jgi:hypothetical protein